MAAEKYRHVVLVDFGSTYTKVAVANLADKRLAMTGQFPSTVATDARVGLEQCFAAARAAIGAKNFTPALKLASSSAAGGLRMGVIGLTRSLSLAVGRNVAFGAGAKVLKTCAGRLTEQDLEELAALPLEILLFCGGYEHGNSSVLEYNAEMLAHSPLHLPIIYAGNSQVAPQVRRTFTMANKEFYVVRNALPNVGELDKAPVEAVIRDIFLKRIINMKNLGQVASMLDHMVMPTPAAILAAGDLLSRGTGKHQGLGPTMIVDVGGATTDIHSYAAPQPYEGAKMVGAKESYEKRTVEGDLGMRESSNSLAAEITLGRLAAETDLPEKSVKKIIARWLENHDLLPESAEEKKVDAALAGGAVRLAARRHAGVIDLVSSAGVSRVQRGKNLTEVQHIIGTGGPIIFSPNPAAVLGRALREKKREPGMLLPEHAQFYLDSQYVFFAAGLLREVDEEAAFLLMKNSLRQI